MSVMVSPLSRMRPSGVLFRFFTSSSSASSSTRFMYSSKPMIRPSMRVFTCSYNQIWMRAFYKQHQSSTSRQHSSPRKRLSYSFSYILQEPEHQVDGLGHRLLDSGTHGCCWSWIWICVVLNCADGDRREPRETHKQTMRISKYACKINSMPPVAHGAQGHVNPRRHRTWCLRPAFDLVQMDWLGGNFFRPIRMQNSI